MIPVSPSWPGLKTSSLEEREKRLRSSPGAVTPVQLAHTFVPPEAAEATVTGGSSGPGVGRQAEENQ